MKTAAKFEHQVSKIRSIRYENPNGGAYAYLQFLAFTRELVLLLRTVKGCDKEVEAIEGMSWLFNECLTAKFTHRHKIILESHLFELNEMFEVLKDKMKVQDQYTGVAETLHAQAA